MTPPTTDDPALHRAVRPRATDRAPARRPARWRRHAGAVAAATVLAAVAWQPVAAGPNPGYVPPNPHLADSPWPTYHASTYAQASTPLAGPRPGVKATAQFTPTELAGDIYTDHVSPWSNLSPRYPDGSQVVWGTTGDHVFKTQIRGTTFATVATHPLPSTSSFGSNHWNNVVLADNTVVLVDTDSRTFYRFGDADPTNPRSPIVEKGRWTLPTSVAGTTAQFNVTYDGRIVFITDAGVLGAVRPDFTGLVTYQLATSDGEFTIHNGFPIDEHGAMYLVTSAQMARVDWTGSGFRKVWAVPYDSTGGGWNGRLGTGTTPTLVGGASDPDRLVVIVDAKSPSNLVAFWRDEAIPADWAGLPGYDRRVAAVTPLPDVVADPAVENSVVAQGYGMAVAQWNGFFPRCSTRKGVDRVTWNPTTNAMSVTWRNTSVNINGVMTYSGGTDLVYGSGREGCTYYFYGLDWKTGAVKVKVRLGTSSQWLDQGNQVVINEAGSAIFGTSEGIVRIRG